MDRRKLIKTMTYALGATIATPTLVSLWTSCKPSTENSWTPLFLNNKDVKMAATISRIILPLTPQEEKLSNIPQFIDLILSDVSSKEAQSNFLKGADYFKQACRDTYHKKKSEANQEEYKSLLAYYLNISKDKEAGIFKMIDKGVLSKENNTEYYIYNYLLFIRKYTIWGYSTANKLIEN